MNGIYNDEIFHIKILYIYLKIYRIIHYNLKDLNKILFFLNHKFFLWLTHVFLSLERGFSLGKRMPFCLDLSFSFLSYIQCSSEIAVPFWPVHCTHHPKTGQNWHWKCVVWFFCWHWRKISQSYKETWTVCCWEAVKKGPSKHHLCFQCESFTVLYDILLNRTREAKRSDIRVS